MQIVIPLFDRFTALYAVGPYEVLSRLPDAHVTFIAASPGVVRTDVGALGVSIDRAFSSLSADDVDVLVVPGGPGTRSLAADGRVEGSLVEWIAHVHPSTTWTASVCTGSLLLGAAGVLDGVPATTHWRAMDLLASYGAVPTSSRVVFGPSGSRLVTAAGVSAGIDMALALAARIAGEDVARMIQVGIEYDPQPPFAYSLPASA